MPSSLALRVGLLAAGLALACSSVAAPAAAAVGGRCPAGWPCDKRSARVAALLDARVEGGRYGFVLMEEGGELLAAWRAGEGFYPASSIKVLYLLEAMRWAAAQGDPGAALGTLVPVSSEGCGGGEVAGEPLDAALTAMMRRSDNLRANAVGDFFGLAAIDRTARDLGGMSAASVLAHRFACGGPANDPANRITSIDLAEVYRRFGAGTLLEPAAADRFASYFLGAETGILDGVILEESAALGRPDLAGPFRARVSLLYKAGWWETDLSVGGYVGLPRRGCGVAKPRGLAFAVFVADAAAVTAGFEATSAVGELLREEIRAALATWGVRPHTCRATWAPFPA